MIQIIDITHTARSTLDGHITLIASIDHITFIARIAFIVSIAPALLPHCSVATTVAYDDRC